MEGEIAFHMGAFYSNLQTVNASVAELEAILAGIKIVTKETTECPSSK